MAVRDGLERLGGAREIDVDLQTNLVTLRCGPSEAIDLAAIPRVIREAGFRPKDMRIRARGEFVADGFRPVGWTTSLRVEGEVPTGRTGPFEGPVRVAEDGLWFDPED